MRRQRQSATLEPAVLAKLYVENSVIGENGGALTGFGIAVEPTGATAVEAHFKSVQVSNNVRGMLFDGAGGAIKASVVNSAATGAAGSGFVGLGANPVQVSIDRSSSTNNSADGIRAGGTGVLFELSRSAVTGNGLGLDTAGGGAIASYGDNEIDHNTSDGVAPTPVAHR